MVYQLFISVAEVTVIPFGANLTAAEFIAE
jgi:hypothetical protein